MGPFTRKRQKMFFELDSALNLTSVAKTFGGNYSSIEYIVDIVAQIVDQDVSGGQLTSRTTQVITFIEAPYSQEVAKWILVTSSGAGILLFLLILVCLISVSHFLRLTPQVTKPSFRPDFSNGRPGMTSNADSWRTHKQTGEQESDSQLQYSPVYRCFSLYSFITMDHTRSVIVSNVVSYTMGI